MANLTQMRMLETLNGFLLVDKPVGIAFSTVVKAVKRKFNLVKVGHGGSLDASASGLFVLLIGDANKYAADVMGADREYEGELKFGETTNTGDCHGVKVVMPGRVASVEEMKGDIFQIEPRFAAIRKEGTAEYEIVDTGEHSQFLAHVYKFEVRSKSEEVGSKSAEVGSKEVLFSLRATKGVLPRAMAMEMGATLMSLRRTKIGKFSVEAAISFDKLLEVEAKDFASWVLSIGTALR